MDRDALVSDIKKKLVSALNLQGMPEDSIGSDTPLFGEDGLGLDSVDALELVVMVENEYGVSVGDKDAASSVFASVNALADYIIATGK